MDTWGTGAWRRERGVDQGHGGLGSGGGTGAHGEDVGTRAWRKWGDGHGRTRRRGGTGAAAWTGLEEAENSGKGEIRGRWEKFGTTERRPPRRRAPPSRDDLSPSSRPRPLLGARGASSPGPASLRSACHAPSVLPSDWPPLGRRQAPRPLIGWRSGAQARKREGAGRLDPVAGEQGPGVRTPQVAAAGRWRSCACSWLSRGSSTSP